MDRLTLVLLLGVCSFVATVDGLKCYACQQEGGYCRSGQEIKEVQCDSNQDTCYSFRGIRIMPATIALVSQDSSSTIAPTLTEGNTTRGCGTTGILFNYRPPAKQDACVQLVNAQDPQTNTNYTGEMCLCKRDFCNTSNTGTIPQPSVSAIVISGFLALLLKI
ncbi:hypothetical protein RvY_01468 [Ramazzottius varieornatus]|uniref:Protein sleepless n=1 Tax=Ramazzottius varieornatus TaxID=947166 RepID=A0A1D1UR59_RAMVA|nr:hypothetical protein RvY_01468 [Ramazzottius varieornatus]